MGDAGGTIRINRAPVLTLWAAVVAERLGFEPSEALTLGRALAGLTAHAKGVRLSRLGFGSDVRRWIVDLREHDHDQTNADRGR